MSLHFPETEAAPSTYTPPPADTGETIVPVYARKPARSSHKKKLLWAIPAVLAVGVAAWALTLGEQGRDETTVAEADTDSLTTSRLSTMETPAATEPSAVSATPVGDLPPVAAPVTAPAPAPVTRSAPAARPSAAPVRRTAPRTSASARAPAAPKATPLPQETVTPVITESAPPPVVITTPPPQPAPTSPPGSGA